MVLFDVGGLGLGNAEFLRRLAASGVRMSTAGPVIRAVTHLDVSREDVDRAVDAVRRLADAPAAG